MWSFIKLLRVHKGGYWRTYLFGLLGIDETGY